MLVGLSRVGEARPGGLSHYLETARHLRMRQVWGWAAERVAPRPRVARGALARRVRTGDWVEGYLRPASMLPGGRVWILNRAAAVTDWQPREQPRLWTYHLHYFEDPRVTGDWLARWIVENPVGEGPGWEPYPLSRRIVNWIRWDLRGAGQAKPEGFGASLATQARWLAGRIEYRLLANHLFVNAKALIYAGTYFEGAEAGRWLATGLRILEREVAEQVLDDGGHYERSPMYHALILEDLLDLEALRLAYPEAWAARPAWRDAVKRMLGWLRAMTHPDGEISFFQDACFGVAGTYAELAAYAARLGMGTAEGPANLAASGYRRLERGELVALFDGAGPGPSYQPGHAHAGTLSVEASWRGGRVLVNSGTSTYAEGAERDFERSTAAHGTVRVDGKDSSEMWGAFRVAGRARVSGEQVGVLPGAVWAEAVHTGYEPVRHRRRVTVSADELLLTDEVTGGREIEWFFPLHPSIEMRGRELWRAGWRIGRLEAPAGVRVMVEPAEWRPEFNRRVAASRVRMVTQRPGTYQTRFCFEREA